MGTGELAESCAAIAAWLPVARALTSQPDDEGGTIAVGGQPSSRPPGNPAAENAVTDAHEGLRRLEASLRFAVTGSTGPRRGGSDGNTAAAIEAIESLSAAVDAADTARAARIMDRWSRAIEELPAVDEAESWRCVRGVACPYCGFPMLRVAARSGQVTCLRYGACSDSDGHHPVGRMDVSRLNGNAVIRWADGLVAP